MSTWVTCTTTLKPDMPIKDSDITKALADSQEALDALEDMVVLDQGIINAGRMLVVDDAGQVSTDIPTGLLLMDGNGTKTYWLSLDNTGALIISEVI